MIKTLVALVIVFSVSINIFGQAPKSGILISSTKIYDDKTKQYIEPLKYWEDFVIWYKDSLVIEKIYRIESNEVNGVETSGGSILDHYLFIDLRTRSYYHYPAFSLQSKFTKKYTQNDTADIYKGGFNFFGKLDFINSNEVVNLPDTLVNNKLFGHLKARRERQLYNGESYYTVLDLFDIFIDCSKKGTIFHLVRGFEEKQKLSCPIIRFDMKVYRQGKKVFEQKHELLFGDRKLTRKEKKIFKKWERNAKKYPVNKENNIE